MSKYKPKNNTVDAWDVEWLCDMAYQSTVIQSLWQMPEALNKFFLEGLISFDAGFDRITVANSPTGIPKRDMLVLENGVPKIVSIAKFNKTFDRA